MKNTVFISYARKDQEIAEYISNKINELIGDFFYSELVENKREGDTTFTEKIISYFKKCNIFIVILTKNSIHNQFVNQEWGYAKSLKEIGRIQIIQHITEKYEDISEINDNNLYDKYGRIISKGFISSNMEFIDLIIKIGNFNLDNLVVNLNSFLMEKKPSLNPVYTEIQQKLRRFFGEYKRNLDLINGLIASKNKLFPEDIIDRMLKEQRYHFLNEEKERINKSKDEGKLMLNPNIFCYDYALQLVNVGHLFDPNFIEKIESYIIRGKELNEWKILAKEWSVIRGAVNPGNTKCYFDSLTKTKKKCLDMEKDINEISEKYELL